MNSKTDLTKGNIFRNVIRLAWPMVLGNILQNAFNVVDMIFVGRLGPAAIGAVALCGLLMQITWTLLIGVSIGTTAMVARFYGAGDRNSAESTAMQSLTLGVVASLLLVLFVTFLGRPTLLLLGAREQVLELGLGYLIIVFSGSFTLILLFLSSSIMRGVGDALTPMLVMTAATALNIALDPLLIFGIWVFPEMGVRGAALATVIAQGAGMTVGIGILLRGRTRIRLHWRQFRIDLPLIGRMLRIALPGTLQGAVRSFANLVLMRIVTSYGVVVLAAYGIGLRLDLIAMMPGWALGAATATLVGQNLGAGQPERAEKSAWIATGLYMAILVVLGALFFIFARQIIGIFNPGAGIVEHGAAYLRIRTLSYVFLATGLVLASALNGAGDTLGPMIILAVSLLGIQLPLAYFLPKSPELVTSGIWLAIAAAHTVQGLSMAAWFRRGRWKQKLV